MRKESKRLVGCLLIIPIIGLLCLVLASDANAFTVGAKWATKKANYVFDQAYNQYGPGWNARGLATINQWNSIGNSPFRFDPAGEGDNHITVDPQGVCSKLAITYITATPTTMTKFTTKVHIGCGYGFYDGTQPYFPSNYYDLETLMRHELGHGLGLCHTNIGILMQAAQPPGLARAIDIDAMRGNRFLYKRKYSGPPPEGACFTNGHKSSKKSI